MIENLHDLCSGVSNAICNDFTALHVTLFEYKVQLGTSKSRYLHIYLNEIIYSIDVNTLIVRFHAL